MAVTFPGEIVFLMVIGSVVLGPKRVVKITSEAGKLFAHLKRVQGELGAQLREELEAVTPSQIINEQPKSGEEKCS